MEHAVNLDSVGFIFDKDTSIDVGVEGSGGVCNTEHSTDGRVDRSGGVCDEGDHEGSGGQCDEGNSTDVAVGASGEGSNEHCSTDVGVKDNACDLEISPGLTKYCHPVCTDSLKPVVGQTQGTIRKRRDDVVVERQVFCSRKGFKQSIYSMQSTCVGDGKPIVVKRRRVTNRVGCKAKVNRSLDAGHQMFIASCVRENIGYVRSYKLFREIVDEYSNVGATGVDFKNFKCDLMAYILNGDAQLFIDTLFKRRELCEAFEFEYDVDDVDQLRMVFWADAVSRKNFALFGDVLFDATYRSNRYNLVLFHLLESITIRDPSHLVLGYLRGKTVGEKVGPVLAKDEVFRRKLNDIVWNKSIDSKAFEDSWSRIMEEYGLVDNGWFRYLFESRTFWASPYFHDEFILVEFLVHFDSAISAQRHAQAKLTADSKSCFPVLKTPLALEKHAMDVYTISVFYDVQVEICEDRGLERIPSMYLVSRWTKGACLKPIFDIDDTVVDQSAKVDNVRVLTNLIWSEIYACVGLADGNVEWCGDDNGVAGSSKESVIKSFCGYVSQGPTVEVRDPIKAKNKGSGKRMKSAREKTANKCVKQ
ncbi:PREDICTED: protein FAR1-RELATED SEQUENCE 6-like [Ipomoea nil]|uniref:protein FAR1-RELATED SEQUENCE 6-like n=1 Tax=Ipomoea nil TaxID=35883 RepID=UPI0009010A9B|nr:PREDICTED: protein FAR1-RELATED SEQUENCE 6-like [Ipomoea nil]